MASVASQATRCMRPLGSSMRRQAQVLNKRPFSNLPQIQRYPPTNDSYHKTHQQRNSRAATAPSVPSTFSIGRKIRWLHTTPATRQRNRPPGREEDELSLTDFDKLDVLGNTPVPSHSVDVCMSDGFQLNSGAKVMGGSGIVLVGGEAFAWRPWLAKSGHGKRLINDKGQWDIPNEALSLLSLIWPRPDIIILGLGPEMRPVSPALRRHISSLGMRVEILDTRNAAAQFNLLVRERGINVIAAALIPIGWREGFGAGR